MTTSSTIATVSGRLHDPAGLHARPAAALVQTAAEFDSRVWLEHQGQRVELTSVVTLLTLGVAQPSTLTIVAEGPDAAEASDAVRRQLEARESPSSKAGDPQPSAVVRAAVRRVRRRSTVVVPTSGVDDTLQQVARDLQDRADATAGEAGDVLSALASLALDRRLLELAKAEVERGSSPASAIEAAADHLAEDLAGPANGYLAARAADLRHIGAAARAQLEGRREVLDLGDGPVILVADDLRPETVSELDPEVVWGLALCDAGPTSHVVIVARSLGIPTIVGYDLASAPPDGTLVELDEDAQSVLPAAAGLPPQRASTTSAVERAAADVLEALDVEIAANVASVADAERALRSGVRRVGLYRTELSVLAASETPTSQEMTDDISRIQQVMGGSPITIRAFDFGSDKPARFLTPREEPNPALGVRGLRLLRCEPVLLERQLTAVARAAQTAEVAVMAPMVTGPEDAAWFASIVADRCGQSIRVGVMIEVPSAVMTIREIVQQVDFVSVGTNDLAQYLHAADRQLGALEELNDPYQPALVRALRLICDAARESACDVTVCGSAAQRPAWAGVAVTLGVNQLSVDPAAVARLSRSLFESRTAPWPQLAHEVLTAPTASAVRDVLGQADLQL